MIKVLEDSSSQLIRLAFVGQVEASDYEDAALQVRVFWLGNQPVRLLCDWTALEEFTSEAADQSFYFRTHFGHLLERVAIVADRRWASEAAYMKELIDGEVRLFSVAESADALAWLSE